MLKRSLSFLITLVLSFFGFAIVAYAAPAWVFQPTILPNANESYDLGTSSNKWRTIYTKDLNVSGTCTGCGSGSAAFPFTPTTFGSTAANATSTLIGFLNGLYSLGTSTIGDGTQAGGLTVSGGATTTGTGIFTTNTSGYQAPPPLTILHVVGTDSSAARMTLDAFSGTPNFIYRAAGGTAASPSALANNAALGNISFFGYGATGYTTTNRASILANAGENWTDSAQGAYLRFYTTPLGAVASTERMRIDPSGNVGIGTTTPNSLLTLQAVNGSAVLRVNAANASGDSKLSLNDSGGNEYTIGRDTTTGFLDFAGVQTTFSGYKWRVNNGTEVMRITNTGNVGIGTSSPGSLLHVGAGGEQLSITPTAQISASSGSSTLAISAASGAAQSAQIFFENQSQRNWALSADRTLDAFTLGINNDATKFLTVSSAGNVGIGTTSPQSKLQVWGASTGQTTAALTDSGDTSGMLSLSVAGVTAGSGGSVAFSAFGSSKRFAAIKGLLTDGTANTLGDLAFSTRNSSGDTALTERMRILAGGNVGIGTAAPASKLHVLGASSDTISQATANLNVEGTGGNGLVIGTISSSPYTSYLQSGFVDNFSTATYAIALNPSGGNVGIGTTTPAARLQVNATATTDVSLTFGASAGQIFRNENSELAIGLENTSPYALYLQGRTNLNAARDITINPLGGNVGIGTTTPWRQLSVGTNNTGKFAISTSTAGCAQFSTLGEVYSTGSACGTGGGSVGNWFTPTTFGSTAANATSTLLGMTQGLYALASSTIGSGTQTGGLTISGGATTTGNAYVAGGSIISTDPGFVTTNIQNTDATPNFQINSSGASASTLMYRYSNNATPPRIFFLKDRGTTSATYAAVSAGDQLGAFSWAGGNGTKAAEAAQIRVYTTGAQTGTLYTPGAIGLWTSPGGSVAPSERLTVYSDGSVGIGTTSPSAKLSVHANNGDTNKTLFAVASSTASATTTHFKVDNTGGVTISGLAAAAGTFVAADPTGKLIATTTPSGGSGSGADYYNTGTTKVQNPPISIVAGDRVKMWYTATLSSGCTTANDLVMGFGYKIGNFAATTTAVTAGQGATGGDRCSVAGSAMFTATTTGTIAPAVFDVASDVGADFTSVMTTVN